MSSWTTPSSTVLLPTRHRRSAPSTRRRTPLCVRRLIVARRRSRRPRATCLRVHCCSGSHGNPRTVVAQPCLQAPFLLPPLPRVYIVQHRARRACQSTTRVYAALPLPPVSLLLLLLLLLLLHLHEAVHKTLQRMSSPSPFELHVAKALRRTHPQTTRQHQHQQPSRRRPHARLPRGNHRCG